MFEFFKKKSDENLIEFGATESWMDYPESAASLVPKWYKKSPAYTYGNAPDIKNKITHSGGNLGLKYCVPFLDALTTGYIATLWQDLQVKRDANGTVEFVWAMDPQVVDGRNGMGFEEMPVPVGHEDKQFIWAQPYTVRVPKGYSVLYTHPLNRYDLPFITLSGIHDSDSVLPPGNFPFYLRDDFEGIIPKGTPIFQMIPFKREDWIGEGKDELRDLGVERSKRSATMVSGYYKKLKWKQKYYRMKKDPKGD